MEPIEHLAVAALAALLPCLVDAKAFPDPHHPARAAAWLSNPSLVLTVRWVRVDEVPQSELRDGVCVLYMPDRDEGSLAAAERLLHKCAATPGPKLEQPAAGVVLLHWHQVTSPEAIAAMRAELYPYDAAHRNAGYYYHPDPAGPCHVITNINRVAVGHELKHCFDGEFHVSVPGQLGARQTIWRKAP
jgi:hypothetical protein